jgi:hypothetical protein
VPFFEQSIDPASGHIIEERETISGRPTVDGMVTLPATLTAVAFTIATGSGAALAGIIGRYYGGWDIPNGVLVPSVAFLSTLVGSVVYAYKQAELFDAYTDMMVVYERTIKPLGTQPPPQAVYVQAGNQTTRLPDEPRPGALRHFALALLRGEKFTEETSKRYGYARDKHWVPLRTFFIGKGWAYWKNPDNTLLGAEINDAGMAWLRDYVVTTSPTPTEQRSETDV